MDTINRLMHGLTKNLPLLGGMIAAGIGKYWIASTNFIVGMLPDGNLRYGVIEGVMDLVKHELYGILADKTHHA